MASQARDQLDERLGDISQLLDANDALTKFRRATQQAQKAGNQLTALTSSCPRNG